MQNNSFTFFHKTIQKQNFIRLQYILLIRMLLTVAILSLLVGTFGILGWLPLGQKYIMILYIYSAVMFVTYVLSLRNIDHYALYAHLVIFSSLVVLGCMVVYLTYDSSRLSWFFPLSFAGFILMGKNYGSMVIVSIFILVGILFMYFDLVLSLYDLLTFFASLLAFTIFMHYFLSKIEQDTFEFEHMVLEEVDKRQTQEQILLRKYRMANMGEMIDAIAHQWRQPLAQGSMILLNMQEELENRQYLKDKIAQLAILNQHMSQTIDDFRKLLHESKHKTEFDLQHTVKEVLQLMKNQLNGIDLQCTTKITQRIVGYKNELIQVLVIILSNAIEALNIKQITHKKISLLLEEKDENVYIHIEDNAGGIKSSVAEKLFDPYITTKKSSGGAGLGLYIAKIIIEDTMQGKLFVIHGAEGARFTLEIKKD